MRRKKGIVCVLMCGVMLLFTGCGEKPYELTKEEQNKIADYAAHVVTKYNGSQEEGLLKVEPEEILAQEEEDAEDSSKQEEKKEEDKKSRSGEGSVDKPKEETVSLNKALQMESGLHASFARYDVTDSYVEADYFAMNAASGKTYLVVHINLEAQEQDVNCDMLSKDLKFRVIINGEKEVGAQTSILLNDLSTYQGTIARGNAQDCVLLFETEKEAVDHIESLGLKVLKGTSSSIVDLQ